MMPVDEAGFATGFYSGVRLGGRARFAGARGYVGRADLT